MRFLVDAQLPPSLAEHLKRNGHEADHVNTIGLGAATDRAIWSHAVAARAVLVTKDGDFGDLSRQDPAGTAVIWIRLGNTTSRALWQHLEPILPEIIEALQQGERLIEVG